MAKVRPRVSMIRQAVKAYGGRDKLARSLIPCARARMLRFDRTKNDGIGRRSINARPPTVPRCSGTSLVGIDP